MNKNHLAEQWPDGILLLTGALKSGMTLEEAIMIFMAESPEPLRSHLNNLLGESEWMPLQHRINRIFSTPALTLVRISLLLSLELGGGEAALLERCADIMRKKNEIKNKMQALTLQSRMTAWVVGLTPFGFMLILFIFSPEFVEPFFTTGLGRLLMGLIIFMVGMGLLVVQKMLKIKT